MFTNSLMKNSIIRRRPIASLLAGGVGYAFALEEYSNRVHGVDAALCLPRHYDAEQIRAYWSARPITVLKRVFEIVNETLPIGLQVFVDRDGLGGYDLQHHYAMKVKQALTKLGPVSL